MRTMNQKVRDYQFDNLKFILIVLVVVGHFIRPLITEFPMMLALYDVIFAFHMPLFVFISGYFAKSYANSDKRAAVVTKLLFTYVIFQTIYYFFYNYVMYEPTEFTLLVPYWTLWYLVAMALWLMVLPYMVRIKYPLIVALVIGMLGGIGSEITGVFALPRVLGFLFFFTLGATFDKARFEEKVKNVPRVVPIAIFVVVVTFIVIISSTINFEWFYSKFSFAQLGVTNVEGVIVQSLLYLIAVTMMFCLYFIVPKRKLFISDLGARTLYVYLLHGFFVQFFHKYGVFEQATTRLDVAIIVLFAVGLAFVLSLKQVTCFTSWIVNPRVDKFVMRLQE